MKLAANKSQRAANSEVRPWEFCIALVWCMFVRCCILESTYILDLSPCYSGVLKGDFCTVLGIQ